MLLKEELVNGAIYNMEDKVRELIREAIFDVMTEGLCPKGKNHRHIYLVEQLKCVRAR